MSRQITIIGLVLLLIAVLIVVVLLITQDVLTFNRADNESDDPIVSTVPLERKDLRTFKEIDGILEYGNAVHILPSNNGVLTSIVSEGEDITRGSVLFKYYRSVGDTEMLTAEAQIASADSAVAQAEAALELLTSDPTEAQIASADSAVAQAEAVLELLTLDPTEAQIASADSAAAQAEAALVNAQALSDTQWVAFRIARRAYCDLSDKGGSSVWTSEVYKEICPDSSNQMSETAATLLLKVIFDNDLLVTSGNDLLIAYENHRKAVESEVSATKALESAKEQRSALDEPPTEAELNKTTKALESAKEQRSALDEPPTEAELNKAIKALESAKEQRSALDEPPTEAELNKAAKALESAKISLKVAESSKEDLLEGIAASISMYGGQPAWRSFQIGMSPGSDIFQLEQNLVILGYDADNLIQIDQQFDEHTERAVKNMQSALDITVTGNLFLGDIYFIPGPSVVQYSESYPDLGSRILSTKLVLALIPIEKVITEIDESGGSKEIRESLQKVNTSIEVTNKDLVDLGLEVSIELPDENIIYGKITEIGDIAVIPQANQGDPYIEIAVSLEGNTNLPEWTGAAVTVSVTKKIANNVLTTPVTSLLALLGGGYAIEIIENGVTNVVPVSVGLYADGWVEIAGEGLKPGLEVVVPE